MQRLPDIQLYGVDMDTLIAALKAAVEDGTITEDEMNDTIIVLEKIRGV